MKKNTFLLLLSVLLLTSCFEDQDDNARNTTVQDFVWRGLNYWSLYKGDVPDLANTRFGGLRERQVFLEQFGSPEAAFDALISTRDRFSILRDDYIVFENSLAGVRRSTGMRFSLFRQPLDESLIYGVVRYVVNNSPAQQAGVQRGMLFTAVNGTPLTATSDFNAIFNQDTFAIDLATQENDVFTLTGESIELTNVELTINPIHVARTIEIDSETEKVGYLHYTGFTNEFDNQLNDVFAQFKADGVSELILDLRYNGGGSVETANDLSTMITGQFEGSTFVVQQYNQDRNPDNEFTRRFNTTLGSGSDGPAINSLNLNRVFVLTTGRTASASELILSGLDPYIEVIQIGTTTTGKFEGSFLLYDAPAPGFRREQANPAHRYVMLPLTFKSVNAEGLTDYFDGFTPDLERTLEEDPFNMGQLGDIEEPLLDLALDEIFPGRSSSGFPQQPRVTRKVYDAEQMDPLYQRMYTAPE